MIKLFMGLKKKHFLPTCVIVFFLWLFILFRGNTAIFSAWGPAQIINQTNNTKGISYWNHSLCKLPPCVQRLWIQQVLLAVLNGSKSQKKSTIRFPGPAKVKLCKLTNNKPGVQTAKLIPEWTQRGLSGRRQIQRQIGKDNGTVFSRVGH